MNDQRIVLKLADGVEGYIPQKDFQNSSHEEDPEIGDAIDVAIASIGIAIAIYNE